MVNHIVIVQGKKLCYIAIIP